MCTATWTATNEGYVLLFNRDELRTRGLARPPELQEEGGVRFLAPIDPDGGGTWLGVNEHGLTVGIGNGPVLARDREERDFTSRGLLVVELLARGSAEEVRERLRAADLDHYRSFALLALDVSRAPVVLRWDGVRLQEDAPGTGALLLTSSKDAERAAGERTALLERLTRAKGALDEALLEAFHASHAPERGPWSPCMHREEASTVSRTRVRVTDGEVELGYAPGPPCRKAPESVLRLARVVKP